MFLHQDGFDHYTAAGAPSAAISGYLAAAGYVVANATNSTFEAIAGQDAGSRALRMTINAGSATPPSLKRTVNTTADKVVFGFAFKGTGTRLRIARIDNVHDLDWDPTTGKMKIGETLGLNVIIMNAWWYIEIVIDKVANTFTVFANDVEQIQVALPGGVGNTHTITWGLTATSATTGAIEIDDFYIADSVAGGTVTDRVGPIAVITRMPTADVVSQWTIVGSAGTNHYAIAAQLDPGALNAPFLQANIEGRTDTFTSNTVLPNDNEIYAVSLVSYARKGDLDERALGLAVETDGGTLELQKTLTEAYLYHQVVFEQAPGGVAWNRNRVESSEFSIIAR